ncbi:hypothetical protein B0H11DRAFT_1912175 [Mycena galericulata]|nr:hypothetical protein B0H11DRAFT_1912175 [Mycena galericulata]
MAHLRYARARMFGAVASFAAYVIIGEWWFSAMREHGRAGLLRAQLCMVDLRIDLIHLDTLWENIDDGTVSSIPQFLEALVTMLHPFLPQCQSLMVSAAGVDQTAVFLQHLGSLYAPVLQTLVLEVEYMDDEVQIPLPCGGVLPSLTSMAFIGSFVSWGAATYYANLRELRLHFLWPERMGSEYFALFSAIDKLQFLSILSSACDFGDPPSKPLLHMPYLTHLEFECLDASSARLLAMLRMPSLKRVHLRIDGEDTISPVFDHCAGCFQDVDSLTLSTTLATPALFADILALFPSIRQFDTRRSNTMFLYRDGVRPDVAATLRSVTRSFSGDFTVDDEVARDILDHSRGNFSSQLQLVYPVETSPENGDLRKQITEVDPDVLFPLLDSVTDYVQRVKAARVESEGVDITDDQSALNQVFYFTNNKRSFLDFVAERVAIFNGFVGKVNLVLYGIKIARLALIGTHRQGSRIHADVDSGLTKAIRSLRPALPVNNALL